MKVKNTIKFLLIVLGIFLITFNFTNTPKVWVDEGIFTEVSRNLYLHNTLGLQVSPGVFFPMKGFLLSTSYPVIFPIAASFSIFGIGVWQARLVMVLYMALFILFAYLFVRKKYAESPAILSTLLLLSFAPF